MKALNLKQYIEIVNFIQKHHKFGNVKEEDRIREDWCLNIKYVNNCYDTRFGDIWSVSFRGFGQIIDFTTQINIEKSFRFDNLYDCIMAYLKGELTDDEINIFTKK